MRGETMSVNRVSKRILVIANETAEGHELDEVIRSCSQGVDAEVLVITPAVNSASSRLETFLERLHAAGIRARGRIGAADPLQAVSDGLRGFAADEIVLATRKGPPWRRRNLVARVRKRFAGPIFHLVLDPAPTRRLLPLAPPVPLIPRLSERR
jgi:hypothetical protein